LIHRRHVLLTLKFTIAIAALIYVVYLVDWERSIKVLRHADWRWLLTGYGLSLLGIYAAALRWVVLLRAVHKFYGVIAAYRAYLTGTFYSLAMPGVIGGDAARVWLCYRVIDASVSLVTATVLLERALGVLALLLLLSTGFAFFPIAQSGLSAGIAPALAAGGLFGLLVLPTLLRKFSLTGQSRDWYGNRRIITFLFRIAGGLAPIKKIRVIHLLVALILSVVFQSFDIAVTYSIAQALEIKLSAPMLLVAMPIVYLATVLPISPGGLGIREGALVFVLAQFGIAAADAALLALMVFFNRAAVGTLGGLQYLASGRKLAAMARQES
jgi:uncharacterized membrane protein YbhN (UPF0104 family)